ncbi:MAG TPA: formimidoylglutamate deiminase [Lichenihabitans sp.]|jgi:formiminoglutamate deiminase|nr:formimidoylglutamate deiminase [Lichenihabitans sp.]
MHKLYFDAALTPEGWLSDVVVDLDAGTIVSVVAGAGPDQRREAQSVGGIAVPGIGNLHSHTFQRGIAGLTGRRGTGDDHFWTWREAMYRLSAALGPDEVEALAALSFVEMLEAGFTGVAEFHYLHHQPDGRAYADPAELAGRVVAASSTTGIGLTLLPVFYAHGGFGAAQPAAGQRRFIADLDLYGRIHEGAAQAVVRLPGGKIGMAPHSLRAATVEEIAALIAAYPDGPVHIHIAEQVREVEDCLAATGARPVDWLMEHLPVDPRWCLVHATHMTAAETEALARSGAVAGLCPITESDLGDGIFPGTAYVDAGGAFGVGSDSNVLISLATELRTLEYSQRLRDRARNRLAPPGGSVGRFIFDGACTGGARALGAGTAALAPGGRADIVVLDPNHPALYGRSGDALLDSWIFGAATSPVRDVFALGKHVVRDGRHVARQNIEAAFRRAIDRVGEL